LRNLRRSWFWSFISSVLLRLNRQSCLPGQKYSGLASNDQWTFTVKRVDHCLFWPILLGMVILNPLILLGSTDFAGSHRRHKVLAVEGPPFLFFGGSAILENKRIQEEALWLRQRGSHYFEPVPMPQPNSCKPRRLKIALGVDVRTIRPSILETQPCRTAEQQASQHNCKWLLCQSNGSAMKNELTVPEFPDCVTNGAYTFETATNFRGLLPVALSSTAPTAPVTPRNACRSSVWKKP